MQNYKFFERIFKILIHRIHHFLANYKFPTKFQCNVLKKDITYHLCTLIRPIILLLRSVQVIYPECLASGTDDL